MELLAIALTILGGILAYIWKANGKMQKAMMDALSGIEEGQKTMMDALVGIGEGQKELAREMVAGHREIAQMLLNQTKILERIEAKIPSS